MAGISSTTEKGKSILVVDCSNQNVKAKAETIEILQKASKIVAANPPKSVLIITVVENLNYDTQVFEAFKAYASANTPYVLGSALVGLSGMQKVMFNAVKALTKRDYYIASSMEDAKSYLTSL